MIEAVALWYVDHSFQVIAGQLLFFALVSIWAWKERGRVHFFSEINMYLSAVIAFTTAQNWAFALLSVSLWVHIALIAREIIARK